MTGGSQENGERAANDITWFRILLDKSRETEETDPAAVLAWLEDRRSETPFAAELIGLGEVEGWDRDPETGNIVHRSNEFFSVEGARITSVSVREVDGWDQPIFNQKEGGVLALVAQLEDRRVRFLLSAKAEPGNIGTLQLAPSIQSTWSNLNRAHEGRAPPLSELITGDAPSRLVYEALHNEEGGRFWRKSNANRILLVGPEEVPPHDEDQFVWATLSQIKALALIDNVLSPYVKTIIAPL